MDATFPNYTYKPTELKVGGSADSSLDPFRAPGAVATQTMTLKQLQAKHHTLNLDRVKTLRALYRGGQHLLGDQAILTRVFPKYGYETDSVYAERCRRAYYENLFALVVNQISAGLAQDPARYEDEPGDEYWSDLIKDATAPSGDGSKTRSLDQVIRNTIVEALVTGTGWLQAEMPKKGVVAKLKAKKPPPPKEEENKDEDEDADEEEKPKDEEDDEKETTKKPSPFEKKAKSEEDEDDYSPSLKDQEAAGELRAYLVQWPTECVLDWYEEDSEFVWLKTYECRRPTPLPSSPKDVKLHVWTIWFEDRWERYEVEERKDKPLPGDETPIPVTEQDAHSFGRVPWTRFDVSSDDGGTSLWVGDIIESLVRAYFNRQNGEAFQWTQYNYQQLYEYLGPEIPGVDTMISEAQQDPGRASRRRAPGQVHVRGNEDRAEFVGPDMGGAEAGRNALQDMRDAILRIVAQMALAQDTSGAMLRRSADSKRQDSVAQEIVLGAIGKLAVVMMNKIADMLAMGRGDPEGSAPDLLGYERFNVMDAESIINQNALIETVPIESATYQIERKFQLAKTHLGDNVGADILEKIREELEGAITQDQFEKPEPIPGVTVDPITGQPIAEPEIDPETGEPIKKPDEENPFGAKKDEEKPPFGKAKKYGFPPKKGGGFPPKKGPPFGKSAKKPGGGFPPKK